ncbi:hypothetical protein RF11_12691 [Thelohanellus kitauei]|uniref:Uncharacterized protein n=1 Tax=Thelohanellus kitauei TaxID=669202 RepID=A0A0C2JBY0_THEKT|nr:hypothetical protein RF11_12691 [Thelohanellus kitauei]
MHADVLSLYIPNLSNISFALARNPFTVKDEDIPATSREEFTELINSDVAKTDFSSITTYRRETRFSSLLLIKSKYRSRLDAKDYLRVLTKINPKKLRFVETEICSNSH